MDKYILDVGASFKNVCVEIKHKPIKNVHLKVYRDLKVVLSVPNEVEDKWIADFLDKRGDWILTQLEKYKQSSGYNNLIEIKSGTSTQLLGKDRRIIKTVSLKNYIEEDEKKIIIYLTDLKDVETHQKLLNKWWRNKAQEVFQNEMHQIFNKVFKKYNLEVPTLHIKK